MRRIFTARDAYAEGLSSHALKWGVATNRWIRISRGLFAEGAEPLSPLEEAVSIVVATGGIASGTLTAVLLDIDSAILRPPFAIVPSTGRARRPGVKRIDLPALRLQTVDGIRCVDGLQKLIDLAVAMDDLSWEHALECALHRKHLTLSQLTAALPELSKARTPGVTRIRRVLALRPVGAPPTKSLLETLAVQMIRSRTTLPTPTRQVEVRDEWGKFVARVDLAWPEHGLFVELDGQHHKFQPVYDADRETAVIAATGWVPARFTWDQIRYNSIPTARRLMQVFDHAYRRFRAA